MESPTEFNPEPWEDDVPPEDPDPDPWDPREDVDEAFELVIQRLLHPRRPELVRLGAPR